MEHSQRLEHRHIVAVRHTGVVISIRFSNANDATQLAQLDFATWSSATSPGPRPATPHNHHFFHEHTAVSDVIVAVESGTVVGYVKLEKPTPLETNSHVTMIGGLAVSPEYRARGIGKLLISAAAQESSIRGARKLSLRVLATNPNAQRFYEGCGFAVEGVLRNEFFIDGRYVDDILMAREIESPEGRELPRSPG